MHSYFINNMGTIVGRDDLGLFVVSTGLEDGIDEPIRETRRR
ncbi:hypothetical protein EDO6_05128 [Paenibacillus xylanexedens]|nr:hypothetical protein EDO6_05128 [Paenibacillus xylanexedens]